MHSRECLEWQKEHGNCIGCPHERECRGMLMAMFSKVFSTLSEIKELAKQAS